MDYKITCICGHAFLLSDDTLRAAGGTVSCPACQQRLSPAIESPPPTAPAPSAASTTSAETAAPPVPVIATLSAEATKRCPFCGEVILTIARKCKHCGEFLDRPAPVPTPASPAPAAALTPTAQPATDAVNEPVFSLTISQWDNFWRFLTLTSIVVIVGFVMIFFNLPYKAPIIIGILLISALIGWFFYFRTTCTRVLIRPLRIEIERGMLGKKVTSLELFRVADIALEQGFIPRILGFGTIKLTTTDADSPELILHQLPRAREVRQYLQTQVPLAARHRGAVYMDK